MRLSALRSRAAYVRGLCVDWCMMQLALAENPLLRIVEPPLLAVARKWRGVATAGERRRPRDALSPKELVPAHRAPGGSGRQHVVGTIRQALEHLGWQWVLANGCFDDAGGAISLVLGSPAMLRGHVAQAFWRAHTRRLQSWQVRRGRWDASFESNWHCVQRTFVSGGCRSRCAGPSMRRSRGCSGIGRGRFA